MVSNTPLSYVEKGQGPVIVFIHGFCESKLLWSDFVDFISPSARVVTLDLPGFGDTPLDQKEVTMEYYADKVHQLLQSLNISKCCIVGHSLGGYVALAFAEIYEQMLNGLVLFHSSVYEDAPEKKENRNKTIDFVRKNGTLPFVSTLIPSLFYSPNKERLKDLVDLTTSIASRTLPEGIIAASEAMRDRKDRADLVQRLSIPVLFIIGKEDAAVPIEKSLQQCHLAKNSIAYFLGETGHMGMFEKREETQQMVKAFVNMLN